VVEVRIGVDTQSGVRKRRYQYVSFTQASA
jgi:hypothetical protein